MNGGKERDELPRPRRPRERVDSRERLRTPSVDVGSNAAAVRTVSSVPPPGADSSGVHPLPEPGPSGGGEGPLPPSPAGGSPLEHAVRSLLEGGGAAAVGPDGAPPLLHPDDPDRLELPGLAAESAVSPLETALQRAIEATEPTRADGQPRLDRDKPIPTRRASRQRANTPRAYPGQRTPSQPPPPPSDVAAADAVAVPTTAEPEPQVTDRSQEVTRRTSVPARPIEATRRSRVWLWVAAGVLAALAYLLWPAPGAGSSAPTGTTLAK